MSQIQHMSFDVRKLPVLARQKIDTAQFPTLYLQAREAMKKLVQIDEIKDVQDKHAALAHYARQAKDKSLLHYAQRVQLRAIERIGVLLREIDNHTQRRKVARENGLNERSAETAYKIAHLPQEKRDKWIDKMTPPMSKTQMASQAERFMPSPPPVYKESSPRETFGKASAVIRHVDVSLRKDISSAYWHDAAQLARSVSPEEAGRLKFQVQRIIEWFDEFDRHLAIVLPKQQEKH